MNQKNIKSSGIGLLGLVFLLFLGLKLGEVGQVANWSWIWVTAPLWIGTAIYIAMYIFFFCIGFIIGLVLIIIAKIKSNQSGYLVIDSKLAVKILVDGKLLKSSSRRIELKSGTHLVTLVDRNGGKYEKNILIISNENTVVSYN